MLKRTILAAILSALLILCVRSSLSLAAQDTNPVAGTTRITLDNAAQLQQIGQFGQGHANEMAFSPDGNALLVGSESGLFAYDLRQPDAPARLLQTPSPIIGGAAYSPDGNLLAVGGLGIVYLWDARTLTPLGSFGGYDNLVNRLAFTSDSKRLFVTGNGHGAQIVNVEAVIAPDAEPCMATAQQGVRVRDAPLGLQTDNLRKGDSLPATGVGRGIDGARWLELVVGEYDLGWGVASAFSLSGSCDALPLTIVPRQLDENRNQYRRDVDFSVSRNLVYTSNVEGDPDAIYMWNAATGAPAGEIQPKEKGSQYGAGIADHLRASPDGSTLVTVGYGIRFFDTATGRETGQYVPDRGNSADRIEYSPDGKLLAIIMTQYPSGYFVRLLNAQSKRMVADLTEPNGIDSLAFSPDSSLLAVHGRSLDHIDVWNVKTRKRVTQLVWEVTPHSLDGQFPDRPFGLEIHANATATIIWDYATGEHSLLPGVAGGVRASAWSPDYSLIAIENASGVTWYDRAAAKRLGRADFSATPYQYSSPSRMVAFSPDNHYMAFNFTNEKGDNFIEVWDITSSTQVANLRMQGQVPYILRFTPDSTLLDSGDDDGKIRSWDWQRGSAARAYTVGKYEIRDLDYSPDGTRLAVVSGGAVIVLAVDTGRQVYRVDTEDFAWVSSVAFSPDGRILAVGSGAVRPGYPMLSLLNAATGDLLVAFPDYPMWTASVEFSKDGTRLLTSGNDGVLHLWGVVN